MRVLARHVDVEEETTGEEKRRQDGRMRKVLDEVLAHGRRTMIFWGEAGEE